MANLMDIYYKVGKSLFENGFDYLPTEQKKLLLEEKLIAYLERKMMEEDQKENSSTIICEGYEYKMGKEHPIIHSDN